MAILTRNPMKYLWIPQGSKFRQPEKPTFWTTKTPNHLQLCLPTPFFERNLQHPNGFPRIWPWKNWLIEMFNFQQVNTWRLRSRGILIPKCICWKKYNFKAFLLLCSCFVSSPNFKKVKHKDSSPHPFQPVFYKSLISTNPPPPQVFIWDRFWYPNPSLSPCWVQGYGPSWWGERQGGKGCPWKIGPKLFSPQKEAGKTSSNLWIV